MDAANAGYLATALNTATVAAETQTPNACRHRSLGTMQPCPFTEGTVLAHICNTLLQLQLLEAGHQRGCGASTVCLCMAAVFAADCKHTTQTSKT
jgi:glucose-6-phosphate dehydrogenase assembly protein OpcA